MCQIQLVKPLNYKNLSEKDLRMFAELMWYGNSYNKDAFGYFSNKEVFKCNQEFDYNKFLEQLNSQNHEFIIGHNRFKTKGSAEVMENNHPFETEHFIVVHNGMINNDEKLKKTYNLNYSAEVDSFIIPSLLEHFYRLQTEKNLPKLLKQVAEELYGSYSVIVFYKPESRLFYFKQKSTDFAFGLLKTGKYYTLLGSTKKDNLTKVDSEYLYGIFQTKSNIIVVEPEEEEILEITNEGISKVEDFKERSYYEEHKEYNEQKYGTIISSPSKSVPSSMRGKMKRIANQLDNILRTETNLEVINRKYDMKNGQVILEVKGEVHKSIQQIIEYDLTAWGDCDWTPVIDGNNKITKTLFIFDVDWSQLRDETDYKNLEKASNVLDTYREEVHDYSVNDDVDFDAETFNTKLAVRGLQQLFGG